MVRWTHRQSVNVTLDPGAIALPKPCPPGNHGTVRPAPVTRVFLIAQALATLVPMAPGATAKAQHLDEFEVARLAYERQEHETAIARFEALLPLLVSRPLILESRKFLGASYMFVGEAEKAKTQFQFLLRDDPSYELDRVRFPADIVKTFNEVRAQVTLEIKLAEEQARERRKRLEEQKRLERERQARRMQDLERLASQETLVEERSRWIASIPFGVGQFQNGHDALGWTLVTSSAALAITSITFAALHAGLRSQVDNADPDAFEQAESAYRVINWASTGALVGLALIGVIDAHLRFEPKRRQTRQRKNTPPPAPVARGHAPLPGAF